jgi:hypothetical protein
MTLPIMETAPSPTLPTRGRTQKELPDRGNPLEPSPTGHGGAIGRLRDRMWSRWGQGSERNWRWADPPRPYWRSLDRRRASCVKNLEGTECNQFFTELRAVQAFVHESFTTRMMLYQTRSDGQLCSIFTALTNLRRELTSMHPGMAHAAKAALAKLSELEEKHKGLLSPPHRSRGSSVPVDRLSGVVIHGARRCARR